MIHILIAAGGGQVLVRVLTAAERAPLLPHTHTHPPTHPHPHPHHKRSTAHKQQTDTLPPTHPHPTHPTPRLLPVGPQGEGCSTKLREVKQPEEREEREDALATRPKRDNPPLCDLSVTPPPHNTHPRTHTHTHTPKLFSSLLDAIRTLDAARRLAPSCATLFQDSPYF